MLRLMAKPASKPAAAKGRRGVSACTWRGPASLAWGKERLEQEDEQERRFLLPSPMSLAKGTDLPLSPPFAFIGGFSVCQPFAPSPGPLAACMAEAVFAGRGVSPGLSPSPQKPPRSQRSRWRGFVGNQTQ